MIKKLFIISFYLLLIQISSKITAQCDVFYQSFRYNPKNDRQLYVYGNVFGKMNYSGYGYDSGLGMVINSDTVWSVKGSIQGVKQLDEQIAATLGINYTELSSYPRGIIQVPKPNIINNITYSTIMKIYGSILIGNVQIGNCQGIIQLFPLINSNANQTNSIVNPPSINMKKVPVYRYRAPQIDGQRYYFTLNSNYGQGWGNPEGIAFYVPNQQNNQTSIAYEYYYDQSRTYGGYRHFFNSDISLNATYCSFNLVGKAFDVYNYAKNQTVPIYRYYISQSDGYRYHYSTSEKPLQQGWLRSGVAFWAYSGGNIE